MRHARRRRLTGQARLWFVEQRALAPQDAGSVPQGEARSLTVG